MSRHDELADHLARITLFSRCTRGELKTVARHAELVAFEPGEVLMAKGTEGDALFVIIEGEVTIGDGRDIVLGPGDHVGELALLDRLPRTATVSAVGSVQTAALSLRMFRTLLREFPSISEQMLAALAGEVRQARDQLYS